MRYLRPLLAAALAAAIALPLAAIPPLPLNSPAVNARAKALLAKLSTMEKIYLLSGYDSMFTHPIPAQNIPALKMSDASVGVRVWGPSTAYPASVALAATWDPKLAYREG
ncbi:MAG: glycosyl hydrolase, partial [Terriglobales bacterium]